MSLLHSVGEVFTPNLIIIIIAYLFASIIAVLLLVHLVAMLVGVLVGVLVAMLVATLVAMLVVMPAATLVTIPKIFVLGLAWMLIRTLASSRHERAKPSGADSDGKLLETSRQEAKLASVRNFRRAGHRGHAGQGAGDTGEVYILFPGRPDRGGQNVGIIVGKTGGGASTGDFWGRAGQ